MSKDEIKDWIKTYSIYFIGIIGLYLILNYLFSMILATIIFGIVLLILVNIMIYRAKKRQKIA